jgi:hypothetical protein
MVGKTLVSTLKYLLVKKCLVRPSRHWQILANESVLFPKRPYAIWKKPYLSGWVKNCKMSKFLEKIVARNPSTVLLHMYNRRISRVAMEPAALPISWATSSRWLCKMWREFFFLLVGHDHAAWFALLIGCTRSRGFTIFCYWLNAPYCLIYLEWILPLCTKNKNGNMCTVVNCAWFLQ